MNPREAYYKCFKKKKRIRELENLISIDSYWSYLYARDIIKGRWEEGEKIIATHICYSYWYARSVIKDHFSLCHPIIFNSSFKEDYLSFLKSINYDLREIGEWII